MLRRVMAIDADDVLVNMSPKWAAKIMAHPRLSLLPAASVLPRPGGNGLARAVLDRDHYDLAQWFGVTADLMDDFLSVYRDDGAFYDGLPPTPFASAVHRSLALGGTVEHVHVITHMVDRGSPVNDSKMRWLGALLQPDRNPVTIHAVYDHRKKSEILKEHCPDADCFADDAVKNVLPILLDEGVRPKEILLPRLGHNELSPQMTLLAAHRQIGISYYGNVLHELDEKLF